MAATVITSADGLATVTVDLVQSTDGRGYTLLIEAATPSGGELAVAAPDGQLIWQGVAQSGDQG